MARVLRFLNLGASGNPAAFAVDALAEPGQIGGVYEDNSMNAYQMFQLVDSTAVANDIELVKSYDGGFKATPTLANSSRQEVAGIATTAVAVNQYTLLQQRGVRNVKFNNSDGPAFGAVVRGNQVIVDRVNANAADTRAMAAAVIANTNNICEFGIAQAAATAAPGTLSTYLKINAY